MPGGYSFSGIGGFQGNSGQIGFQQPVGFGFQQQVGFQGFSNQGFLKKKTKQNSFVFFIFIYFIINFFIFFVLTN